MNIDTRFLSSLCFALEELRKEGGGGDWEGERKGVVEGQGTGREGGGGWGLIEGHNLTQIDIIEGLSTK